MSPILVARCDRVQRSSRRCASQPSLLQVPAINERVIATAYERGAGRCKCVAGIGKLPGTSIAVRPMVARCRGIRQGP
jgi:hypothetical protein